MNTFFLPDTFRSVPACARVGCIEDAWPDLLVSMACKRLVNAWLKMSRCFFADLRVEGAFFGIKIENRLVNFLHDEGKNTIVDFLNLIRLV